MERWYRAIAITLIAAALVAGGVRASAAGMAPAEHVMHAAACADDATACAPAALPLDCAVHCIGNAAAPDAAATTVAVQVTVSIALVTVLLLVFPQVLTAHAVPLARAQSDPDLLRTVIKRE